MKKLVLFFTILTWYTSQAQFAVTKRFSEPKYSLWCGGSVVFDSLGYFFKEHGCEGDRVASFGRYTITGNRIRLTYLPHDSMPILKKIVYSNYKPTDSTINVRFFDRFLNVITLPFIEYRNNGKEYVAAEYSNSDSIELRYSNAVLDFFRLGDLYKNSADSALVIPLTNRSMDIYFNLPHVYFNYNLYLEAPPEEKITEMLFVNRGLYSMDRTMKHYILE